MIGQEKPKIPDARRWTKAPARSRVDFANTLRGFAAMAVVISHYYGVFWLNRAAVEGLLHVPALPESHPVPAYVAAIQTIPLLNWGAYGVALFFLVSGFVIPFSLQRNTRGGFLVNRLFRIIPTYAAGFSITLLALFAGTGYFGTEWPYGLRAILVHYLPGLRDVLWSPNIDGIIWTLEIEMKFYLVCALVLPWFRRASLKVFVVPAALVVLFLILNPGSRYGPPTDQTSTGWR